MKLAVAFALMTTGVAAQGCPTVADFTDGIITRDTALAEMYLFKQVDGQCTRSLLTYATAPNPVTQPTDTYDMSRLLPFEVSNFDHLLFIPTGSPQDRSRYTYQKPVRDIATLFVNGQWENRISMLSGQTVRQRGTHKITVLEEATLDLGECSYATYRLEDTISLNGEELRQHERWYAPDLGLVLQQSGMMMSHRDIQNAYKFDEVYRLADLMAE